MILSMLIVLSSGQFFTQACKQGSDCNLNSSTLSPSGNGLFTPRVTGNGTGVAGQLRLQNSSGAALITLDTSSGTRLDYNSSTNLTLDNTNVTTVGPGSFRVNTTLGLSVGDGGIFGGNVTANTFNCTGSTCISMPAAGQITSYSGAYFIQAAGSGWVFNQAITNTSATPSTFNGGLTSNSSLTVANDAGIFLRAAKSIPACNTIGMRGFMSSLEAPAGSPSSVYYCDGINTIPQRVALYGGLYVNQIPVAKILSRTIASGVITTGNVLLGTGDILFASSSSTTDYLMNVIDNITFQCATAGTGAGNITINFRNITDSTVVCGAVIPCTSGTLAVPRATSCTAGINGLMADFGADKFGTTLDVSACTTPPADCTVYHEVYTN